MKHHETLGQRLHICHLLYKDYLNVCILYALKSIISLQEIPNSFSETIRPFFKMLSAELTMLNVFNQSELSRYGLL